MRKLNPSSVDWQIVETWATERLEKHRNTNDSISLDPIQTAYLRGRITELKALTSLARPVVLTSDQITEDE